jgi:hypothetical protein
MFWVSHGIEAVRLPALTGDLASFFRVEGTSITVAIYRETEE